MDEPLMCWMFLIVALIWAYCTRSEATQQKMKQKFGRFTPLVQWYNVTFVLLTLLFLRTVWDIVKFEYIGDKFLSWGAYKGTLDPNTTGIPLSDSELNIHTGPLVIPSWVRVLSLLSPLAGLAAFAYSAWQVYNSIVNGTDGNETMDQKFLHMVVRGMPLVFIVMALRATIRQWAVMTGSCWLPYRHVDMSLEDKRVTWASLKAAEISTYTQDLEVASGFQFFAVWCFGQVCSRALRRVLVEEARKFAGNNTASRFGQQSEKEVEAEMAGRMSSDARILLQLGILGLHSFVILGVIKTVVNMIIAMCSADYQMEATVEPLQQMFLHTFDPVFLFATILSVINMVLLGKMEVVEQVLPSLNTKFNATRALLLIGQGQLTLLRAATTSANGTAHASKILTSLHKIPFLKHLSWWFSTNQARLVHSSLLCFECLLVVILNDLAWKGVAGRESRKAAKEGDPRRAPLLDC